MLQKLQFTFRFGILPKDYQLVHIEIPDEDFLELKKDYQKIGKHFRTLILLKCWEINF